MLSIPSILIGVLFSSLYGVGFHLLQGGNSRRLILYVLLGWAGFWVGHFLGDYLSWTFSSLGPLRLGMATLTAFLFLAVGKWLSPRETGK